MRASRAGQDGYRNGQAPSRTFWDDVLNEHAPWLRQVILLRVGEAQAVDEVWQEVAFHVCRRAPELAPPTNVGAWLYRIAIRQALLFRRRAGRQRRLLVRFADRGGQDARVTDPLTWLLDRERRQHVRQALQELPVRDAQVLVLKYDQDWSYHQIAEHLGLSTSAVEARLHRARQRLRLALRPLEPKEDHDERH